MKIVECTFINFMSKISLNIRKLPNFVSKLVTYKVNIIWLCDMQIIEYNLLANIVWFSHYYEEKF
jgi:hypothetical protein